MRIRLDSAVVCVLGVVTLACVGCAADEAIDKGTQCEQACPLGAEMEFAKEASGSCGADGSYTELGEVSASGKCEGSGACQVVCMYPKCGETQTLKITADAFICEASTDPCYDVDCDGHGDCRVESDSAVCECEEGYVSSGVHCDQEEGPVVTVITPTTAKVGVEASFTIVGERLPDTLSVEIPECTGLAFSLREETTQVFVCTPQKEAVVSRKVLLDTGDVLYEDEVTFVLQCDDCEIESACYSEGDVNPANECEECDPVADAAGWTFRDGRSCDDELFCNGPGICDQASGECKQQGNPCQEDGVFCNGSEVAGCSETTKCAAPGSPCEADQYCSEVGEQCLEEVVVNVAVANSQQEPRVASWADGSFVVGWVNYDGVGGFTPVVRIYSSWGEPKGQDVALVATPVDGVAGLDLATRADGSFVAAWSESSGPAWNTKIGRFTGEGEAIGTLATFGTAGAGEPQLGVYPGLGSFVVVQGMKNTGATGSETNWIWAQGFNEECTSLGAAVKLNEQKTPSDVTTFLAALPDVAVNSKGNKAFVWFGYDEAATTPAPCIYVRTHASMEMPSGPGYAKCIAEVGDFPLAVGIAANEAFDLYVVWAAEHDGQEEDTFVAWFQEGAVGTAAPQMLNQYTEGRQFGQNVVTMPNGAAVVWVSGSQDGDQYGVYGRRVDGTGMPLGDEFAVNVKSVGDQRAPALAALGSDAFVVVWQGDAGLDTDIFMRKVLW